MKHLTQLTLCCLLCFSIESYADSYTDNLDKQITKELEKLNQYAEDEIQLSDNLEFNVQRYEIPAQTAQECSKYEKFDSYKQVCYYQCKTDQQCEEIERKIEEELENFEGEYKNFSKNFDEYEGDLDELKKSVQSVYKTQEDGSLRFISGIENEKQKKIKNWFNSISPRLFSKKYIDNLFIYFRKNSNEAAFVDRNPSGKWDVYVNIDVFNDGEKDLVFTLVHEFAHILTLNSSQVDGNIKTKELCSTYLLNEGYEGCTRPNSYFTKFHKLFWKNKYSSTVKLYQNHPKDFVSDYAATNPSEDIAESFAVFVFKKKVQKPLTIAEEKINFFYSYEELVTMRENIRKAITPYVHAKLRSKR
jgi:hypothetical protein